MTKVVLKCPECPARLRVDANRTKVRCPKCGAKIDRAAAVVDSGDYAISDALVREEQYQDASDAGDLLQRTDSGWGGGGRSRTPGIALWYAGAFLAIAVLALLLILMNGDAPNRNTVPDRKNPFAAGRRDLSPAPGYMPKVFSGLIG